MPYLLCLSAAFIAAFSVYALRLKKAETAAVTLLFSVVLGLIFSKLFYVLLLFNRTLGSRGLSALLRFRADEFSFFGAGVGVCAGVILSARCFGIGMARALDAFAPAGALLTALTRFSEIRLDTVGVGEYCGMGDEPLNFFPFAVTAGDWGEYYWAVFMLEALIALVIFLVFLRKDPVGAYPGLRFLHTLFYLCLTQIFCESRRALSMKWGFVRAEQVLCGVCVLAVILLLSRRGKKGIWPFLTAFLCIAGMVGVEFALDKTRIPHPVCYAVMIVLLGVLGVIEVFCAREGVKCEQKQSRE